MLKFWKKSWEPFGSCLLNSTANPAKLGWKWAGLAVLFSRQLSNGSHNFFQTFSIYFLNYFIKNPQTTITLAFLTHNISAIGGVTYINLQEKHKKKMLKRFVDWLKRRTRKPSDEHITRLECGKKQKKRLFWRKLKEN